MAYGSVWENAEPNLQICVDVGLQLVPVIFCCKPERHQVECQFGWVFVRVSMQNALDVEELAYNHGHERARDQDDE